MALAVDGRALGGGGQPPRRRSPQMRLGALSKSKSLRAGAAAQSKAQSKAVRQAGMSAAPNAVSDRLDIQQSFQSLFHDKSEEEVLNQSRFNNLAFDRDTTSDGVELIKRKIRAASYRDGGQDWDTLFLQHDRDGNGELDINEFTRALRHTAGVSRQELSDDRLRKLFDMVDADGSGEISADEFADFIKFKPKERSSAARADVSAHLTGLSIAAAEQPAAAETTMMSSVDNEMTYGEKLQIRHTGVPFVAEYICVRRAVLREGASLNSRRIGHLDVGEVVAVVKSESNRLKVVRLRWGDKPDGWVSERRQGGFGENLLEKLPRAEWSAVERNDDAIATRVSALKSAQELEASCRRNNAKEDDSIPAEYWSAPLRQFLAEGPLPEDKPLPTPPPGWRAGPAPTPRGMAAADLVQDCRSMSEVSAVLDALEQQPREHWLDEVARQRSHSTIGLERSLGDVSVGSSAWSESETGLSSVERVLKQKDATLAGHAPVPAWDGPREIVAPGVDLKASGESWPVSAPGEPPSLGAEDEEAVGVAQAKEALERVGALLAEAEAQGVAPPHLEQLREGMQHMMSLTQ